MRLLYYTRCTEHKNNKNLEPEHHNVITKHHLQENHDFDWENVQILHKEKNLNKRNIPEMFYIKKFNKLAINTIMDSNNFPKAYEPIIYTY